MNAFAAQIGSDAASAVQSVILAVGGVREITLFAPPSVLPLQKRTTLDHDEAAIVLRALALRGERHFPFWDAAMLSSFESSKVPEHLLDAATLHNSQREESQNVDCASEIAEEIRQLAQRQYSGRVLAVSSRVQLANGSVAHLPMLDFHCPESPKNLNLVSAVLRRLRITRGVILRSGKSYHFYGAFLLSQDSFVDFLARALLFCPIIDRAWISHQLIETAAGLRVSGRADGTDVPTIVSVLNDA